MVDEKENKVDIDHKESLPTEAVKDLVLDEKSEIDLRELQIKLEKIKAYVGKTDGRVQKHEKELQRLRDHRIKVESERQAVSVATVHKYEKEV